LYTTAPKITGQPHPQSVTNFAPKRHLAVPGTLPALNLLISLEHFYTDKWQPLISKEVFCVRSVTTYGQTFHPQSLPHFYVLMINPLKKKKKGKRKNAKGREEAKSLQN